MSEYDDLKKKLLEMRSQMEHRIETITKDILHTDNPPEQDFAEQAVEHENDEVMDALGSAAREELVQVKRALIRIEEDEYGYCLKCGEEIDRKRLEAIPYADKCMKCAE